LGVAHPGTLTPSLVLATPFPLFRLGDATHLHPVNAHVDPIRLASPPARRQGFRRAGIQDPPALRFHQLTKPLRRNPDPRDGIQIFSGLLEILNDAQRTGQVTGSQGDRSVMDADTLIHRAKPAQGA
jgi:hypothetical protein